jgi:hypothetical protein
LAREWYIQQVRRTRGPASHPVTARLGEITFAMLRRGGVEDERAVEAFRILLIYSPEFAAFEAPRLQTDSPVRTSRWRRPCPKSTPHNHHCPGLCDHRRSAGSLLLGMVLSHRPVAA